MPRVTEAVDALRAQLDRAEAGKEAADRHADQERSPRRCLPRLGATGPRPAPRLRSKPPTRCAMPMPPADRSAAWRGSGGRGGESSGPFPPTLGETHETQDANTQNREAGGFWHSYDRDGRSGGGIVLPQKPPFGGPAPNTEMVPPAGVRGAAKPIQALSAPEIPTIMSAAEVPIGVVESGVIAAACV